MAFLSKFSSRLGSRAIRSCRQSIRAFGGAADPHHHHHKKIDWNSEYMSTKELLPEREEWTGKEFIWIKESGPLQSNTVLVFTHRFMLDSTQWDPVVEKLNKKYRCLQWDLRRHGKNADKSEHLDYVGMAHDIREILRSETMGQPQYAVFIGEELGGWVSNLLLYLQSGNLGDPFTVDGLVLINTGFKHWRPKDREDIELILGQWRKFGLTSEVASLLASYHFDKPITDPVVQPWLEKWKKFNPHDLFGVYRYLHDMNYGFYKAKTRPIDPVLLYPFRAPTLLIRGSNDRGSLTNEMIQEFAHIDYKNFTFPPYPRKVVEIEGGKNLSLTQPQELTNQIEEFLSTIDLDLSEKVHPRIYHHR